jgi:hypothetical protein
MQTLEAATAARDSAPPAAAAAAVVCTDDHLGLGEADLWYQPFEQLRLPRTLRVPAEAGDAATIDAMLIAGADPDVPDSVGTTPLLLAVRCGHTQAVDSLIAGGASVNQIGAWDYSPLMYAAIFGHEDIAETLLECGADASLIDVRGETALEHAVGEGHIETAAVIKRLAPVRVAPAGPLRASAVQLSATWMALVGITRPWLTPAHGGVPTTGLEAQVCALRRDVAAALRARLVTIAHENTKRTEL